MKTRELLLRIVAVSLLLYSIGALCSRQSRLWDMRGECCTLQERCDRLRAGNAELYQRAALQESDQALRQMAWERLGMVVPGETVFYFVTDREG